MNELKATASLIVPTPFFRRDDERVGAFVRIFVATTLDGDVEASGPPSLMDPHDSGTSMVREGSSGDCHMDSGVDFGGREF